MIISKSTGIPPTIYRHSLFYLSLLLIITAVAYWPISFHVFSLKNDALNYFLPVRYLVSESYNNNILPLWTPYLNLGYPLHGDMQSGVWNPIVQLFSLFGTYTLYSLQLETLLYVFLSGTGLFFLLKHFKVHPYANLLASVAFMLCGFNSDSGQFLNWIAGTAFLPFVFLFYHRSLHERSVRQSVYTGIALFFLFNCAYPADFILSAYVMAALLIQYLWTLFRNKETILIKKMILPHLAIIIIFLLLAGPAVLSYYESLPLTERGAGASYKDVMSNPLHPALLSSYTTPLAIWKMPGVSITDPLVRNSYIGIIGFILLIVAYMVKFQNRLVTFSKWAVIIFLLFSFGEMGGIRVLAYYTLPLLNTFRHPANARMFTLFFSCILVGFAYHAILNNEIKEKYLRAGVWITCAVSLIVFLFSLFTPFSFLTYFSITEIFAIGTNNTFANHIKVQLEKLSFSDVVLITTLIQVPFLFVASRYLTRRQNPKLLLVTAIVNCILFTMLFQPFTVVKKQKASLIQNKIDNLSAKGYPLPDNNKTLEENSLENEKYMADIGCQNLYNKMIGRSNYRITPSNLLSQNAFWFNEPFRKEMMKNKLIYKAKKILDTKYATDEHKTFLKNIAFMENHELGNEYPQEDTTTFSFTKFEPNRIELLVSSKYDGPIVLMQNYYPRWKLYIDGKPVAIEKTNLSFMGFILPKGEHTVAFQYEAKAIRIVFIISLAVLGILLLYIIFHQLSNKKITS